MPRLPTGLACALSVGALAACNSGGDPESRAAESARQVGSTVAQLERSLARREFGRVCRELFTRAVRERAGGRDCPAMLRRTARGLRRPRIEIRSVSLRAGRAEVRVTTRAEGQAPAPDTIELLRQDGRWRIAELGG